MPRPRGEVGGSGGGLGSGTEADTPPSRQLLLRTVRILLECILVIFHFA